MGCIPDCQLWRPSFCQPNVIWEHATLGTVKEFEIDHATANRLPVLKHQYGMHSRAPCFRAQEFTVLNSRGQMGSVFQSLCSLLWTLWLAPQQFPRDIFQSHLCGNHSFCDGYKSLANVPEEREKKNKLALTMTVMPAEGFQLWGNYIKGS